MWFTKKAEFSVIFLATLGLAACGGSSGSGSSEDDSSLTENEQAAVAAQSATGTVSAAQSFTSNQTSSTSSSGSTTRATTSLNCNVSGSGFTNDSPSYDVTTETFPEPSFTNPSSWPSGTDNNRKFRADACVNETTSGGITFRTEKDGASDTKSLESISGRSGAVAQLQRLGGYQGDNSAPDTSSTFDLTLSEDGVTTFDFSARGEIYTCEGCLNGDLSDFSGDTSRDETVAMFLDAKFGDSQDTYSFTFGNSFSDPLTFQSSVVSSSVTAVEIDGGIEFSASGGCDFSAEYNTVSALQIENYQTSSSTITGGEIDVTVDGSTNTVTFEDGTVKVNGDTVDTSSIDADCNTFGDVSTS